MAHIFTLQAERCTWKLLPVIIGVEYGEKIIYFKGELNPNNKLGLNDSFSTRINKYNPHTVQFCVV